MTTDIRIPDTGCRTRKATTDDRRPTTDDRCMIEDR
jgi:hypothetical protein